MELYHIFLIQSSVDRHSCCFYILASVNNGSNIFLISAFAFLRYVPRSGNPCTFLIFFCCTQTVSNSMDLADAEVCEVECIKKGAPASLWRCSGLSWLGSHWSWQSTAIRGQQRVQISGPEDPGALPAWAG